MTTIFLRTLIIYIILTCTMRFMGKRQLGELELSELVTTLLLSEIASMPITNQDIPLGYAVIPIVTLMTIEVLLSAISLRIPKIKQMLTVRPSILIRDGKIDHTALRSSRISSEELLSQLRLKNAPDPGEVEYAILEPNGQISVIPKASARQATTKELGVNPPERGIMHLIVADGQINDRNLAIAGKDRRWLSEILQAHHLGVDDIFLLLTDDCDKVRIIPHQCHHGEEGISRIENRR